ncbi:MAG: HlyD family efflux transporter periplasmic adaptor subunit [Phycisphaerae bacterium]|jgi:multidrug resistance efflux pump|nr:HlyD family efflux transporter periplasmic adaptor subunit [Phycisphaerae bacterium]
MPFFVLLGCVYGSLWLWQRQGAAPHVSGAVEAVRLDVPAAADGRLVALSQGNWDLFDKVKADQVVARLDDRAINAALRTLQRELKRLRQVPAAALAELELEQFDRDHEARREAMRLAWELERRRLDVLDRQAQLESDRVILQRLDTMVGYLQPLVERGMTPRMEYDEQRLMRDEVARRIEEKEDVLAQAREQLKLARQRVTDNPAVMTPDQEKILAPLRMEIGVQEARIDALRAKTHALEVRAPISGTIMAVHAWPGQSVRAGDPIVTIAADHGRYIVSYIRQSQRYRPEVNTPVTIRTRDAQPRDLVTQIDRVGPQVALVPPHQRRDPQIPEWGLPVRIEIPPKAQLSPGELVDVSLER